MAVQKVVVNLSAGTATLITDLDKANAKIREIGPATRVASGGMREAAAASKIFETGTLNNQRAISSFIVQTLKLGPALNNIFPIIGGLAFASMLFEVGGKVVDFFKNARDQAETTRNAFEKLSDPLRLTNDELGLSNARLENEIAKLEGHTQNNLKVALEEASLAADKLSNSLEQAMAEARKTLEESKAGIDGILTNASANLAGLPNLSDYLKQEQQQLKILDDVQKAKEDAIRKDKSLTEKQQSDQMAALGAHSAKMKQKIYDDAKTFFEGAAQIAAEQKAKMTSPLDVLDRRGMDQYQLQAHGLARTSDYQSKHIGQQESNTEDEAKKQALEQAKFDGRPAKEASDLVKSINAEADEAKAKLLSLGQPQTFQDLNKAAVDAKKAILGINKSLEENQQHLSKQSEAEILVAMTSKQMVVSEAEWETKLSSSLISINNRIAAQKELTQAIGKGYEATKEAYVQTQLANELGAHQNDQRWMDDPNHGVDKLKAGYASEFDSKNAAQSTQAIDTLKKQIELENQLATAHGVGDEAARLVDLKKKLDDIAEQYGVNTRATANLQAKAIDLYEANKKVNESVDLQKLKEQTSELNAMAAAARNGAESLRVAALNAKYQQMANNGVSSKTIDETMAHDTLANQERITLEAAHQVTQYSDEIEKLKEIEVSIIAQYGAQSKIKDVQIARKDIEKQILELQTQQLLKTQSVADGFHAFLNQMETDTKSTAKMIADELNKAFDGVNEEFSKFLTGQKTNWKKMFQGLAQDMVKEGNKALMQQGMRALAKKLYGDPDPAKGPQATSKPTGGKDSPFYVYVIGSGGGPGASAAGNGHTSPDSIMWGNNGILGTGQIPGGDDDSDGSSGGGGQGQQSGKGGLNFLMKMLGQTNPNMFMAEGGDVSPGSSYIVGENAPEFFTPRSAGTITPMSKMGFGGSPINYSIDARGSQHGTENRIARAIEMSHASAVHNAAKSESERKARTPQRKH